MPGNLFLVSGFSTHNEPSTVGHNQHLNNHSLHSSLWLCTCCCYNTMLSELAPQNLIFWFPVLHLGKKKIVFHFYLQNAMTELGFLPKSGIFDCVTHIMLIYFCEFFSFTVVNNLSHIDWSEVITTVFGLNQRNLKEIK